MEQSTSLDSQWWAFKICCDQAVKEDISTFVKAKHRFMGNRFMKRFYKGPGKGRSYNIHNTTIWVSVGMWREETTESHQFGVKAVLSSVTGPWRNGSPLFSCSLLFSVLPSHRQSWSNKGIVKGKGNISGVWMRQFRFLVLCHPEESVSL